MLKKHKNIFMEIIKNNHFNESLFQAKEEEDGSYTAFIIELHNTPLKFITRNSDKSFYEFDCKYVKFGPDYEETDFISRNDFTRDSEVIYDSFKHWLLKDVKDYLGEQITLAMALDPSPPIANKEAYSPKNL